MTANTGSRREAFSLRAENLSKKYGSVQALRNVSFEIAAGEIVAFVGDNGAGKSTLLKCLAGTIIPDEGRIEIGGSIFTRLTPRRSVSCGIFTVYQDLALVEALDVAANIFLGMEPLLLNLIVDRKRMYKEAALILEKLGIDLPSVHMCVKQLSGGQRQAVAIARAVIQSSFMDVKGLLLLDEPTAAMGVRESSAILDILSDLRCQGHALLCISHNIPQIFDLADRIYVMRSGEVVWGGHKHTVSLGEIISLVSGVAVNV